MFNPLTPNDPYRARTAPLTSKRFILNIYSTNIGTEYFKHSIYSPFFPLQNAVCFIILNVFGSYIIYILYTGCAKIKKIIIPAPKGYRNAKIPCFVAVYCKMFMQTDRHCVSGWAVVLCVSKECSGFAWRVRRSTKILQTVGDCIPVET
jgi:hypothetical protein